jgi:ubiquinone/menaquinone biosynthesis C-methylase UbiE
MKATTLHDAKARAIEQWTADPAGPNADDVEGLLAERRAYAPWMREALDYRGARGLNVLDVGCGQGIDLCEYARAGATVTGIDLTPMPVKLARQHLDELGLEGTVMEGDAEDLPFPDETYDRVCSNGVLHHTPDMLHALREIHRVLRPGGRATVIVYNRQSAHFWIQQVLRYGILGRQLLTEHTMGNVLSANVEKSSIGARPLVRVYGPRELHRLLAKAEFTKIEVSASPLSPAETFVTAHLPRRAQVALARVPVGWYLVARGSKRGV